MNSSHLRPLFSCVAENSDPWLERAFNLTLSIRNFGGSLAASPVVINFVGAVDKAVARKLRDLGATVRIVEPYAGSVAPTNKLRMLELGEEFDFDVLVALDCDILVMGDLSSFLSASAIRARPEARDPIESEQWRVIFSALDIPEPPRNCIMRTSGRRDYPYFNSGVVFVPGHLCEPLQQLWARYNGDFDALWAEWPGSPPRRWWTDQIGFACAIGTGELPFEELPIALNFPTIFPVHHSFAHEVHAPFVVHYHNEIDDRGYVLASRNRAVNRDINRFNTCRAELLGQTYSQLPRPPLARRLQIAAVGREWYANSVVKRVRFSRPSRALKKLLLG